MASIETYRAIDQMQQLSSQITNQNKVGTQIDANLEKFGDLLLQQINKVNEMSQTASKLQEKFSLGDPEVTLPQVMIATQKSSVYTSFLIESRNKLLSAYSEIMNMTV